MLPDLVDEVLLEPNPQHPADADTKAALGLEDEAADVPEEKVEELEFGEKEVTFAILQGALKGTGRVKVAAGDDEPGALSDSGISKDKSGQFPRSSSPSSCSPSCLGASMPVF